VAAWAFNGIVRDSTRPPGGVFAQPPESLTPATEDPFDFALDAGTNGTTALTWAMGKSAPATSVRAAVRPDGGAFGPIATLTPSGHRGGATDVAVDPNGNAAAVWIDTSPPGQNPKLVTAEYDATPPRFAPKTFDLAPAAGQPASYSATATDDWSHTTIGWAFGDGPSTVGGS